jgi:coenzyme F420-reducing hydrogenase beta subunit
MLQAALKQPLAGAQWTGITTRIAEKLLEAGEVDAVIAMAPHPDDPWRPLPVIVTRAADMARCRGMRMGYAPLVALVEPALQQGHKRLAVIGVPCSPSSSAITAWKNSSSSAFPARTTPPPSAFMSSWRWWHPSPKR